jgi:hypothetical protein
MLKSKAMTPGSIVSLRILNGDELIARLKEANSESVTLTNPMVVAVSEEGAGAIPWFALGDASVVNIKMTHVYSMVPAKLDAAEEYTKNMARIESNV